MRTASGDSEKRDRRAASTRTATEIVRKERNSVVCPYNSVCVCVSGNFYLYHHNSYIIVVTKVLINLRSWSNINDCSTAVLYQKLSGKHGSREN